MPYSPRDVESLSHHYNPAQLASLLSGESTIDLNDFYHRQSRPDYDPMKLRYLDDLSTFDPLLDFPSGPQPYVTGHPLQPLPRMAPTGGGALPSHSDTPWLRDASLKTGFTELQIRRFRTKILVSHSVVNQTRMGKLRKIYCLAVAGNGNGLVGIGEGKSVEYLEANRIATYMAVRNMMPVPRYEDRTIYGDLDIKVGAVELKLFSRPPGMFSIFKPSPPFLPPPGNGLMEWFGRIWIAHFSIHL
jgi:small subunit ribosomal protein S5